MKDYTERQKLIISGHIPYDEFTAADCTRILKTARERACLCMMVYENYNLLKTITLRKQSKISFLQCIQTDGFHTSRPSLH